MIRLGRRIASGKQEMFPILHDPRVQMRRLVDTPRHDWTKQRFGLVLRSGFELRQEADGPTAVVVRFVEPQPTRRVVSDVRNCRPVDEVLSEGHPDRVAQPDFCFLDGGIQSSFWAR